MEADRKEWLRRLAPAAVYQFAFVASVTLLKSAGNAAVLARFPASVLPYLYVGSAALTAAFTGFATRRGPGARGGPSALALIGALCAVGLAIGLHLRLPPVPLFLYLFAESFATYASIGFWARLGDAFDAREGRRAFTALSGIGIGGAIIGGLLAQLVARGAGAGGLVAAAAGMLLVGAAAFRVHRGRVNATGPRPRTVPERSEVWGYLAVNPYGRGLGAIVLMLSILNPLADYLFRVRAASALNEDELAALFGQVQLWMGVFCVLYQLLIAERLLKALGILRYFALVPLLLAPLGGWALLDDRLWPAYAVTLLQSAATLSILPVALQLLYAPLPDTIREGMRSAIDGLVKKTGVALGGILLIVVGTYATARLAAGLLIALCLAVGWVLMRMRRSYVGALAEQVDGAGATAEAPLDGGSALLLIQALDSPNPDRVLRAMSLMEQSRFPLRPHLPLLLAHGSERVVERAVRLSVTYSALESTRAIEDLLARGARRPRAEAVWALAKLAPARARTLLPALLNAREVGLRCAAIGALSELGPREAADAALRELVDPGTHATVAERREVARVLGRVKDARWTRALEAYLEDPDPTVRRVAISAAGEGGYLELAPRILPFLTWRDERQSARSTLAALGDGVVPLLAAALNDRSRPTALRYQLPRVLWQLGTEAALATLLFSNIEDDAFLHYRIGVALSRLREEKPELPVDATRVREALGRRRGEYRKLVDAFRDLRAALGQSALLTRVVGDRLDQAYEVAFWLLGCLYPARSLRRIHQHLVGADPRRRAYALELLENLVPEEDRALVIEQTEAHHRQLPLGAAGRLPDQLGLLCHSDDRIIRACARQLARGMGLWTLPHQEDDMSESALRKLFSLEDVEIFAQTDVDDLAAIAALAKEQTFRKGERIYAEGDPGDALYIITAGSVDAVKHGETVMTMREKEVFGDVSLLDGTPRPTDMIAAQDVSALVIERRDFLDLLSDRPELLQGIFRVVSRQLKSVLDLPSRRTGETPLPPSL